MSSGALRVTTEYTSVACSCTPHSLDWGDGSRLCFGACSALAVATPLPGSNAGFSIHHTLHHHRGDVISVRWARDVASSRSVPVVVTGSRDHTAALWDFTVEPPAMAAQLSGHAGPVTLVDAAEWKDEAGARRITVATTATDCTLRLWEGAAPAAVAPLQTLTLGRGLALALRLAQPPAAAAPWLFVGTDEAAVVIFAPVDGDAAGKENVPPVANPSEGSNTTASDPATSNVAVNGKRAEYAPLLRLTGHEDWVRCLDAVILGEDLLLASAGQDSLIRVWTVRPTSENDNTSAEDRNQLKVRSQTLTVLGRDATKQRFSVTLDSVLAGHEGWVYGLRWQPVCGSSSEGSPPPAPRLASASMDRALLVWQRDPSAGVWVEAARLGAVGGNTLGLYGCAWSPDGARLVAHGHRGALHVWAEDEASPGQWRGQVPLGGHAGPVVDLAWAPGGGYLLSTGQDQTTRLHACWQPAGSWHEMGRPQVHGHDMSCLAAITDTSFASGAEEKVARAFSMPGAVRDTLTTLCGAAPAAADTSLPEGAAVPSLGLTNKPVFAGEERREMVTRAEEGAESYFLRQQLTAPPPEETLLQNTLWPELRKLYGHGFELIAMAASHDGRLLATACRAAKPEHTSLLLWDSATWRQVGQLTGAHQLTVVQMAFSPGDEFLLAVSRDRTWSLWARQTAVEDPLAKDSAVGDSTSLAAEQGEAKARVSYQLCARGAKAHARIIWCCAWLDGVTFVTGSRDGQLQRWRRAEDGSWAKEGQPCKPGAPVTAVAAAVGHPGLVAVGLETGEIRLLTWDGESWTDTAKLDTSAAHHGAVKRLQFRPCPLSGATELLASCAADHAVKLHRVTWEGGEVN